MGTPCLNLSPADAWANRLVLREANFSLPTAEDAKGVIRQFLKNGVGPIAEKRGNDMFPADSAKATAKELVSFLPPPAPIKQIEWATTPRTDTERNKFTVTPQEFVAAIDRTFAIADGVKCRLSQLDDSVFLLEPP